jgi:hypothetical protein
LGVRFGRVGLGLGRELAAGVYSNARVDGGRGPMQRLWPVAVPGGTLGQLAHRSCYVTHGFPRVDLWNNAGCVVRKIDGPPTRSIESAAKLYLKKDNYVRVTLLPEAKKP